MEEASLGQMLKEGLIRAIPQAALLFVALVLAVYVSLLMVKQEVKEAIEYGTRTAMIQSVAVLLDDDIFNVHILPKVKQNTKEAIEYTIMMAKRELFEPSFGQPCKK